MGVWGTWCAVWMREFIKNTVLAGVGSSVFNVDPTPVKGQKIAKDFAKKSSDQVKKIIVGGGGIGGLCCAYELMKKGHDVVVLEASGRHGGHVYTAHDELSDGLYGLCRRREVLCCC